MTYEEVVTYSKTLERLLKESFGATGRGLHAKVTSVEAKLPALVVRGLRVIASARNSLIHEDGVTPAALPADMDKLCKEVVHWLSEGITHRASPESRRSAITDCQVCRDIPARYPVSHGYCGQCKRFYQVRVGPESIGFL